jgi:hypothetical protein
VSALTDPFLVNTKKESPLNANAPSSNGDTQVSNFVTAQSFGTFAIATAVLKTVWELLQGLFGSWAESYWTPFVICLIYGAWQFTISLTGDNRVSGPAAVLSALLVTLANSAVLAASIIGLTETTGVGKA